MSRKRTRVEPENRKGWAKLRRGLPESEAEGRTPERQWNYERLVARFGANGAWILVYILDRTQSGYAGFGLPPPEYTRVILSAAADFLNVTIRRVRGIIRELQTLQAVQSRCPEDPWSLKALPENFEEVPVRNSAKRPGRPRESTRAEVTARKGAAFFQQQPPPLTPANFGIEHHSDSKEEAVCKPEIDFRNIRKSFAPLLLENGGPPVKENQIEGLDTESLISAARIAESRGRTDIRDAILGLIMGSGGHRDFAEGRIQGNGGVKPSSAPEHPSSASGNSVSPSSQVNFRDPETRCPFGLGCPYLENDLDADKPLVFIELSSRPVSQQAGHTLDEIRVFLQSREVLQWFVEEMPTERIVQITHANMQGAPLDGLRQRIKKRGPSLHSMGIIPDLAKEVGDRWKLMEPARLEQEEGINWTV